MRLLDRYLLRELFLPLIYCLLGFQVFWTAFDLYSHLDEYRDLELGTGDVALLYLFKMPDLLGVVLPVALLLALLYTLTNLSRHNEIAAMRGAGLSLARISRPYLAVGAGLSMLLFVVTEFLGPRASLQAKAIQSRAKPASPSTVDLDWVVVRKKVHGDLQILGARGFNKETLELRSMMAEFNSTARDRHQFLPDTNRLGSGTPRVSRGEWTPKGWVFYNVHHFKSRRGSPLWPNPEQAVFREVVLVGDLKIEPREILKAVERRRIQAQLTSHDAQKRLLFTVRELLKYGQDSAAPVPGTKEYLQVHTQLHGRLAEPLRCVVVVLIALPFGVICGKRSAFVGVAVSVGLCFSYFMLFRLGLSMGMGEALTGWGVWGPLLAAWLPNLGFAILGLGLCSERVRRVGANVYHALNPVPSYVPQ